VKKASKTGIKLAGKLFPYQFPFFPGFAAILHGLGAGAFVIA
jgi:hypothetical protein